MQQECIVMNAFVLHALEWMAGIIGSLIVVFFTQLINVRFFTPKRELAEIVRRLSYTIGFYSNRIANPGPENAAYEAGHDLRSVAMELKAFIDMYPKCKYKKLTADDLNVIATKIVFLSNSIHLKKATDVNKEQLDMLRKELREGKLQTVDDN